MARCFRWGSASQLDVRLRYRSAELASAESLFRRQDLGNDSMAILRGWEPRGRPLVTPMALHGNGARRPSWLICEFGNALNGGVWKPFPVMGIDFDNQNVGYWMPN